MKNSITLLLLTAVAIGCSDLDSTSYRTEFLNDSGHSLEIKPYHAGVVDSNEIISMNDHDQVTANEGSYRGIGKGECYALIPYDSIVVVFDGTDSIVHNCLGIPGSNPKSYQYSSPRNLRNVDNYGYESYKPKKHQRNARFLYTFTYQDYLDAQ